MHLREGILREQTERMRLIHMKESK